MSRGLRAPVAALVAAGVWLVMLHPAPAVAPPQAARGVVRLHVVANANDGRDLAVKLAVRRSLLRALGPILRGADSASTTLSRLKAHLGQLDRVVDATLGRWGAPYGARLVLGPARFPTKNFGPLRLPQGTYPALTVILGKGRGQNWWCLLFPQLCLANPLVATEQGEGASPPEGLGPARTATLWQSLWQALARLL